MSAFLEMMAAWLVDYFAAATAVLATACGLRLVLRQPAARMAAAWSACLGLVALAVLTALPAWPRFALEDVSPSWLAATAVYRNPQPVATMELPIDVVAISAPIEEFAPEPMPAAATMPADVEGFAVAWHHLVAGAWLAAAALASGWVLLGHWRTRRLLHATFKAPAWVWDELQRIVGRTARHATWGIPHSAPTMPGLLASSEISSAVAIGALAPQIILPQSSLAESNRPAVNAALAHEWAHICHGDLWLLAIERLLLPLLAVHPLFWWLRRNIRLDQELLADAAAAGDEPAEYAEALLVLARTAQPARHGLAALSMWEHPSTLSRRVAMILDSKSRVARPLSRAWTAVTVALALPAILALSAVSLRPTTAQDKPAETEAERVVPPSRPGSESPSPIPRAESVPITQVHLELLVLSVLRDKLAAADTSLEAAIADATASRCRQEAGLVVSEIKPDEVVMLLDGLKKQDAIKTISRPNVITLDGREANVHIGGEAPVLRVEETINGKHERRVEFKEFGTMLMVRPKLSGEKADLVTLDILAEQANLVPPGEKAAEGAVPRDVPGLVSHKFKLTADVKLGGSLLVAESPADKKQLLDAVKQQFLLIVTPKRAVRTAAAVYADPAAGDKGEAARAATEAAIQAATAAEPEAGTLALSVLQAEHDAREKGTADLKRQIELLQRQVERLQAETGTKMVTRTYKVRHRKAADVADDVKALVAEPLANGDVQLTVDDSTNSIVIQLPQKHANDFGRTVEALDGANPATTEAGQPPNEYAQAIWRALAEKRSRLGAGQPARPPAAEPAAQVHAQQANWGVLTADVAEARLGLERAEKEFARIEQLKASKAISEEQLDEKKYALELAKIQLQRAEAKLYAPASQATARLASQQGDNSRQTEVKLLELDLADAKLAVEEAESELQRADQLRKQSPSAISEQEIRKYQFQADRAKIQLQRIMVKLEAAKADEGSRR